MIEWTAYIKIFTALLAIVNPLGIIPIFVSLTSGMQEGERKHIARTASPSSISSASALIRSRLAAESCC